MNNIVIQKFGVRLRPVHIEDAEFIFNLRRDPKLSTYIGDTDPRLEKQVEWLERYFLRKNDYYFCIENYSGKRLGTIALYDIRESIGEWGRWVVLPSSPASPPSAWLIYHVAFGILNLTKIYCRTVEDNKQVVSFHDSCGVPRTNVEYKGVQINGQCKNLIVHTASKEDWQHIQEKMKISVGVAERLLNEVK